MRGELEMLNARLVGGHTGMERHARSERTRRACVRRRSFALLAPALTRARCVSCRPQSCALWHAGRAAGRRRRRRGWGGPAAAGGRPRRRRQRRSRLRARWPPSRRDGLHARPGQRPARHAAAHRHATYAHTHRLLHAFAFRHSHTSFLCAEQDAALSSICATVGALKRTSYAIGEELTLQEGLLESFEADVDKTSGTMRRVEQRAAQLAGARSLTARGEDGAPPAPPTWAEEAQASCSVM
jgi:hypothetical protein